MADMDYHQESYLGLSLFEKLTDVVRLVVMFTKSIYIPTIQVLQENTSLIIKNLFIWSFFNEFLAALR